MSIRAVCFVLTVFFAQETSANGGPVTWSQGSFQGGITPLAENQVSLVDETLDLVLEPDGNHFYAVAKYSLVNSGNSKQLLYGVPLLWPSSQPGQGVFSPELAAREMTISVNEALSGPCVLDERISTPVPGFEWLSDSDDPDLGARSGWCVASLEIPAGKFELTLKYRGKLLFVDEAFTTSALTRYGVRKLIYPFFAAGYWNGRPRRLQISLRTGLFDPLVTIKFGPKARRSKGALVWNLEGPDLRALPPLVAEIKPRVLESRELATWNGQQPVIRQTIKVSSQRGAQNAPSLMSDGDPRTAWCDGGLYGRGSWVELVLPPHECTLEGFGIVPGNASSEEDWKSNGRVRQVRISSCTKKKVSKRFSIDHSLRTFEYGAELLRVVRDLESDVPLDEESCFRFEIEDFLPGTRHGGVCIGELAPIYNCG